MKAVLKILMVLVVVAPLMACQKGEQSKRSSIKRSHRGTPVAQQGGTGTSSQIPQAGVPTRIGQAGAHPAGAPYGAFYSGDGLSDSDFNLIMHNFVSATMDPQELGYVSGQLNQSTGVRFWARVAPASGVFNPNGMTASISPTNSELRIVIWDSYAGTVDINNEVIPEYPVHVRGTASGTIQGNRATVYFSQTYQNFSGASEVGYFVFDGSFDGQYYQGRVWYNNNNSGWNDMGNFYAPTCSFFKCN